MQHNLTLPLSEEQLAGLRSGNELRLSGIIYTARDAAHQKLIGCLDAEEPLPFAIEGAFIYYAGPSPAPPGQVVGAIGPTTSGRMDAYTPRLLKAGLRGMIGKGRRNETVREAMREHRAVYLAALGGAAALLARTVISAEIVAWPELGAEALCRLEVEQLPLIVVNDIYGGDLYGMTTE